MSKRTALMCMCKGYSHTQFFIIEINFFLVYSSHKQFNSHMSFPRFPHASIFNRN